MSLINFKSSRQSEEFKSNKLDRRLRIIIYALAGYTAEVYHKPIIITEIFRTQNEQDTIYGNDPKYKSNPWFSVHQEWRGFDFRTIGFTKDQIIDLLDFLNDNFEYNGGTHPTSLYHEVENHGLHIHVQVDTTDSTIIKYHHRIPT